MSETPPLSPRSRVLLGIALLLLSAGISALVYHRPEGLNAPAWVAHAAGSTFFFAGLLLLTQTSRARRLRALLASALLLALALPGVWVTFGLGGGECQATVPFLSSEIVCRGAFGIGTLLVLGALVLSLRLALKRKHHHYSDSA